MICFKPDHREGGRKTTTIEEAKLFSCSQFVLTEHSHFCFLIKNKIEKFKYIYIYILRRAG